MDDIIESDFCGGYKHCKDYIKKYYSNDPECQDCMNDAEKAIKNENRRIRVIYFAHPMSHYNTEYEQICLKAIENKFQWNDRFKCEIMNPNRKWLSNAYLNRLASGDSNSFEIFTEIVRACDIIIGVRFFDGSLGAGVAKECKVAKECNKQVLLLDRNSNFSDFYDLSDYTVLSRADTRQRKEDGII